MPSIADLDALFGRVFGCSDSRSEVASLYSALWAGPQTVLGMMCSVKQFYVEAEFRQLCDGWPGDGVLMLYFSINSSQAHFERGSAVIHVARSRPSTLLYGLGLRQSLV
ncbi:hypothetical protein C8J56DRAFT_1027231 [Mycena floridula]|nr:hypothetical protein C8J56DRAFT_1027231 [Mycena floridula]